MTTEAERYAALRLAIQALGILWDEYTLVNQNASSEEYIWLNNTIMRMQAIADAWGKELVKS